MPMCGILKTKSNHCVDKEDFIDNKSVYCHNKYIPTGRYVYKKEGFRYDQK